MITNGFDLGITEARRKALDILNAGFEAINIKSLTYKRLERDGDLLRVCDKQYNLRHYSRVFVVAVGKGSSDFALTVSYILKDKLSSGIALDIRKPEVDLWDTTPLNIDFLVGSHPLPSLKNVEATRKILRLLKRAGSRDLVLILITGGGSSLLCGSVEEMNDMVFITKLLTRRGANINELNTVRKHLSEVKGGQLAGFIYPATSVSLVASDVCSGGGDLLSMVASGPTILDETTVGDAREVLQRYGLMAGGFDLKETPKDSMIFDKMSNILFACNEDALTAMKNRAVKLGFKSRIDSLYKFGEARRVFYDVLKEIQPGEAVLMGGETTVTVKGKGKGGRNQEAVLGALDMVRSLDFSFREDGYAIISAASDGNDNTPAGGAIGDGLTLRKAEMADLSIIEYLTENDSFNFFKEVKDQIKISPTSFNVADFMLVLRM